MIPFIDGLTLLRKMRLKKISTPVLFLTAKDTVEDMVIGLDSGADNHGRYRAGRFSCNNETRRDTEPGRFRGNRHYRGRGDIPVGEPGRGITQTQHL